MNKLGWVLLGLGAIGGWKVVTALGIGGFLIALGSWLALYIGTELVDPGVKRRRLSARWDGHYLP
jgi:hypothetical protein